jgi:hypothetical protein
MSRILGRVVLGVGPIALKLVGGYRILASQDRDQAATNCAW